VIYATYITYTSLQKKAALGLPQLGVRFLADSNSWNVNGTTNLKTVRQMFKKARNQLGTPRGAKSL